LRGERLEAFLTQPFYVAEPFTKRAGEWVPLADTLAGVRRILDGAADTVDPVHLRYIGALRQS
jgi:F-type H+-transporting ATPase subunit beta